jgi:hypothetical protein
MEIMSEKAPSKVDTAATVAQRRDNALRRALSTPPKLNRNRKRGTPLLDSAIGTGSFFIHADCRAVLLNRSIIFSD